MSRQRRSRGSSSGGVLPGQVAYNIALALSISNPSTRNNRDVKSILDKLKRYNAARTRAEKTDEEIQELPERIRTAATDGEREELKHALNVTRKEESKLFRKHEKTNMAALQSSTFELWNKSDVKKLAVPTDRLIQGDEITALAEQLDEAVGSIGTGSGSRREPEIKREHD